MIQVTRPSLMDRLDEEERGERGSGSGGGQQMDNKQDRRERCTSLDHIFAGRGRKLNP